MTALADRVRRLWDRVQEPRNVTLAQTAAYVVTLLVGISALTSPPDSLRSQIGPVLSAIWASFLILGGALGALAAPPGIWWIERVAVLACGTGLVVYGAVVITLYLTSPSGNRLPQAGVIALCVLGCVMRWMRIRRYSYDPEAASTRLHH